MDHKKILEDEDTNKNTLKIEYSETEKSITNFSEVHYSKVENSKLNFSKTETTKTNYSIDSSLENKKAKNVKNISVGFFTGIFVCFIIIFLISIFVPGLDYKTSILSTIVSIVFGNGGKSLYNLLTLTHYEFDEDEFKSVKTNKQYKTSIYTALDILSATIALVFIIKGLELSKQVFDYLPPIISIISIIIAVYNLIKTVKIRKTEFNNDSKNKLEWSDWYIFIKA